MVKFSKEDLEFIRDVEFYNPDTERTLREKIATIKEDYIKFEYWDEDEGIDSAIYTLAKKCPIEKNICVTNSTEAEGGACFFFNIYNEKCVYPRTCIHNYASDHELNIVDSLAGDFDRYWKVPHEQKAATQIIKKCKELGIFDQDHGEDFGEAYCPGWAYAEFDDDGKKVTLAELATDEEMFELLKEKRKQEEEKEEQKYNSMKSELDLLVDKYSGDVKEDIERIMELTKKIF